MTANSIKIDLSNIEDLLKLLFQDLCLGRRSSKQYGPFKRRFR